MANNMTDVKTREGANKVPTQLTTSAWWQSTNFFASVILFFAGFWGLSSAQFDLTVKTAVLQIFAIVGTAGALRVYLVNAKLDVKKWLSNPNAYQYVIAALTGIIPNIPADAGSKLFDLIQAIKTGNIGIIISAIVTFAVFAYNVWINRDKVKA